MVQTNPARIGLVRIHCGAGIGIRIGQWLNGSGFEDFEHAFMDLGDGTLIQAEPGGAQIRPLSIYADEDVHWCDNIYKHVTPEIRKDIAEAGRVIEGVPYSFLDYWALALHHFHVSDPALQRYIATSKHLICSQLVDYAYLDGGFEIFSDQRWAGYVTPGDLYLRDLGLSGEYGRKVETQRN